MSGITITDDENAATFISACGGVSIPLVANPDNIETADMVGTDCGDSSTHEYFNSGPTPIGPGPQTISLDREFVAIFQDDFIGPVSTNISADTPTIGGPWTQIVSAQDYQLTGGGEAQPTGAGIAQYTATPGAAGPDQSCDAMLHADGGWSDTVEFIIRYNAGTNSGYLIQLVPPDQANLVLRVAGVDTILGNTTFAMPVLADPPGMVNVMAIGDQIHAFANGGSSIDVTDATLSNAGVLSLRCNRAVGQPVLLDSVMLRQL